MLKCDIIAQHSTAQHSTAQHSTAQRDDIVEWDVVNWWKFIQRIEKNNFNFAGKKVLELGAGRGGLSLYYALRGAEVTCSDVRGPAPAAVELHRKYHVDSRVEYKTIDAMNIPEEYNNFFDFVTFKSVLGGIGFPGIEREQKVVDNIERCLKPGGFVLFAENMKASALHSFCRKHFRKYGWRHQTEETVNSLFKNFELVDKFYCGFSGCFGLNKGTRKFLGYLDTCIFEHIVPEKWKYIGIFMYRLT